MSKEKSLEYKLCKHSRIEDQSSYSLNKELHDFIYDMKGCITGWNKMIQPAIKGELLCYTCSTDYNQENEVEFNNYVKELDMKYEVLPDNAFVICLE